MKTAYSFVASAVLIAGLGSGLAWADTKLNLNDVISIEQALEQAKKIYPDSQVVEAELEDDKGGLWELKLVTADGTKQKLYLDAHTGERRPRAYD